MRIKDRVYGEIEITDSLIEELINSAPMQRLKEIGQAGATTFLHPQRNVTRFEHSIGVWHILERFGASKKEQVAGLLHDTPHTAFSHIADVVFPNEDHSFHDRFTEQVIMDSEIPVILKKYNIEVEEILDKEQFHLLDAELPDLSADRIDYFLRDTRSEQLFPDSLVKQFLDGLSVEDSKFYFRDRSLACLYSLLFIDAGRLLWLDPSSHGSYFLLAEALKKAMKLGELTEKDFFKTDKEVFAILKEIKDKEIETLLSRLNPQTRFVYADKSEAEFFGPNKPRAVDPLVKVEDKMMRISNLVPDLKVYFEHYKKSHKNLGVSALG